MNYFVWKTLPSPLVSQTFSKASATDNPVTQTIRSFGLLEDGWDFGVGAPATKEVIEKALFLHKLGSGRGLRSNAFPGTDGEINIAFYFGADTIEVRVNTDLSLNLTHERGIGPDFDIIDDRENIELRDIELCLVHLKGEGKGWKSSEYCIQKNMIRIEAVSPVTPLETTTTTASRSLTPVVYRSQGMTYATT
jgi:hypothetical protein